MKVWRPELTPTCGLITFALYTIVFIVFGVILNASSNSVIDFSLRYDNIKDCIDNKDGQCTIKFTLPNTIPQPVYFYY